MAVRQMMRAYFSDVSREFGTAWTRFWFTPRDSVVLCLMRVLTGIMALYYIVSHSADLVRWFGPDGILNASTTQRLTGAEQLRYSFHYSYLYLAETPASLWILHGAGVLVVLAFTLGIWSRLTSIGALIVVLAYVHRAPLITGQFEPVLTMLLAYLCSATGRHFSFDAVWARHRLEKLSPLAGRVTDTHLSLWANISTRLIQLHLAGFCLMTGLNMLSADTWWAGEGVWWLIARTESRLVDLTGLAYVPLVINLWSHAIVAYLLLFGVLAWHRLALPILLSLGVLVWVSLALVTGLVAWCVTMFIASLAFIEPCQIRAPAAEKQWARYETVTAHDRPLRATARADLRHTRPDRTLRNTPPLAHAVWARWRSAAHRSTAQAACHAHVERFARATWQQLERCLV